MSFINESITNDQVIPSFETDLFDGHEGARFAVGIIAVGDQITDGRQDEFDAYLRLRANVYAHQTRMISTELVRDDGTEMDDDDARSVHFGIFERAEHGLGARAVAAMRLIVKSPENDQPLPIEEFFPDAFPEPAPMRATEVSRYISRHEDPATQARLSNPLFTHALSYVMTHNLGPAYGVVEPRVEAALIGKGVPLNRIHDPVFVPEYAADNLGMEIDTETLGRQIEATFPGAIEAARAMEGQFSYFGRPNTPVSLGNDINPAA